MRKLRQRMGLLQPCLPHQLCKFIIRSCRIGPGDLYQLVRPLQIPVFKRRLDRGLRGSAPCPRWQSIEWPCDPSVPCSFVRLLRCFVRRSMWRRRLQHAQILLLDANGVFLVCPVNSDVNSEAVTVSELVFRPNRHLSSPSLRDFHHPSNPGGSCLTGDIIDTVVLLCLANCVAHP